MTERELYDNYEVISRRDWKTGEAIFITFPEVYATITSTINTYIELDENTAFGKEPEKADWFIYRDSVLYNEERAFLKIIMEAINSVAEELGDGIYDTRCELEDKYDEPTEKQQETIDWFSDMADLLRDEVGSNLEDIVATIEDVLE